MYSNTALTRDGWSRQGALHSLSPIVGECAESCDAPLDFRLLKRNSLKSFERTVLWLLRATDIVALWFGFATAQKARDRRRDGP
jgi:hypothetical protein